MIKSMTGFSSLTSEDELATLGVTIRGVNHRYLDVQLRLPQPLSGLEGALRAQVQRRIARGRVEITIVLQVRRPPTTEIEFNEQFASALASVLDRARVRGFIGGDLSAGDLLRFPQALAIREQPVGADDADASALARAAEAATEAALADLDAMRRQEGEYLATDLEQRRARLAGLIDQIATAAAAGRGAFEARLEARVAELKLEIQPDPAAISQEIVRIVARGDISEELVRFRGHLEHWRLLADAPEPCGRKLDFLLQEMNREVNTVGAKAEGPGMTGLIVTAKAELEKMREQVQNVE